MSTTSQMEDLFRPPDAQWHRLSRNYLTLKLLSIGIWWPVLFAIALVPLFLWASRWVFITVAAGCLVWWAWRFIRAPRAYRRWGYAETDSDVYLTRGLWFRSFDCVPYGRMQVVNVSSGPIERLFGLATVEMVTSSTSGSISIPGLEATAAAELRDRLIERGEELQAGI